jgi:hypothetical protein
MRFNFITVYSDIPTPLFAPSAFSKHAVIGLRGALEPIFFKDFSAFFGPVLSSFDSSDFALLSKSFKARNSYLSSYSTKKLQHFGSYSNLTMYSNSCSTFTFEKNVVLFKIVRNFRYNSIVFRANGFRFGSLSLSELSSVRTQLFQFFRNFGFYKLFARLLGYVFTDRANTHFFFLNFIVFFKSSFFRYFSSFVGIGRTKTFLKRFNRQKIKYLKQAFIYFFFFQKQLGRINTYSRASFRLVAVPSFYLSESIFFSSRFGFQKGGVRRFLPLSFCLFFNFN